jgi:hypothetical protein
MIARRPGTEYLGELIVKAIARKPRLWDATIPVTDIALGTLEQWPAHMQDQVYAAMEIVIAKTGVKGLEIIECKSLRRTDGLPIVTITVMEKLGSEDVVIVH